MSENSKVLAYEYEYNFDDRETCIRAGVAIECMIDIIACNLGRTFGNHIQFEVVDATLYIRTSSKEPHDEEVLDKFMDTFFEVNSRFIEE